ncbi:MAG: hypothetical protein CSA66_06195 [Proteobacteria bacterium]|nr:MAG: hypothetical protein CSA66_06195 [Pseudomonadota bacterium]
MIALDFGLEAGLAVQQLCVERARSAARGVGQGEAEGAELAAARQFEALLLEEMVEAMRKTVPKTREDLPGQALLDGMQDRALADHLAVTGGIGLADLIVNSGTPARRVAPLSVEAALLAPPHTLEDGDLFAPDGLEPVAPMGPADGRPLRDQLPPETDPWLQAPDAGEQLRRLILDGAAKTSAWRGGAENQ